MDLQSVPYITLPKTRNQKRVRELESELDPGEAEALALAEEIGAEAVLIDEATGRRAASRLGLPVLGTLGILLRAKERGVCGALQPLLDELQGELHFHISPGLHDDVLRQAGE